MRKKKGPLKNEEGRGKYNKNVEEYEAMETATE